MQCSPFTLSGNFLKYMSSVEYLEVYLLLQSALSYHAVGHLKVTFYRVLNYFF